MVGRLAYRMPRSRHPVRGARACLAGKLARRVRPSARASMRPWRPPVELGQRDTPQPVGVTAANQDEAAAVE